MAAYSAVLRGASKVYVIDRVAERLSKAKEIGCTPIDFTKGDAVEQVIKANGGEVDRAVDAVGYQAVQTDGKKEQPNVVLDSMVRVVRPTGGLGAHLRPLSVPISTEVCRRDSGALRSV